MKNVIVSIHDCTAVFTKQIRTILDLLDACGVVEKVLLVTPRWHGRSLPNSEAPFCRLIRTEKSRGSEIALHGFHHCVDPAGSLSGIRYGMYNGFEFLASHNCAQRLKQSASDFHRLFGYAPRGFVPPLWMQKKQVNYILKEMNFSYVATVAVIKNLRTGKRFHSVPINHDFGGYYLSRILAPLSHMASQLFNQNVVRVAIHPADVDRGLLERQMQIITELLGRGYTPTTYENLICTPS